MNIFKLNQKGEITLAVLIAVGIASALVVALPAKVNPIKALFSSKEESAVGKKASFSTQTEKIKNRVYTLKENQVLVAPDVELTYQTGMDFNVPRPTFGEKIGTFFYKASTFSIIALLISIICFGGAPIFWLLGRLKKFKQNADNYKENADQYKETLKKTVEGVRKVKEKNPEAYVAVTNELAIAHDKKDKVVVDEIKTELNK